jgi:hypothetical protein
MQLSSISNWDDHITAGRKYLKTASNGRSRPAVFNNELVFQLAAMAIERFIVGLSQYHHRMPVDHTLAGLVAELGPVCPMSTDLADRIKGIEIIDDMCSLSPAIRIPPGQTAVREILAVCHEVQDFVDAHLGSMDTTQTKRC